MNNKLKAVVVVSMLAAGSVWAESINGIDIDFVTIGNANNAADTTDYGAVGYNYRIGTTEVTVDQFTASGLGSGSGDTPAVNMTWHTAAQYCNWLTSGDATRGAYTVSAGSVTEIDRSYRNGNGQAYVLPTEDEWYKAAYFTGSGYSIFANGTATAPVQGTDANYGAGVGSGATWAAGSGAAEQNGTFDMGGNVWEWLESTYGGEDFDPNNGSQLMAFRGGDAEQVVWRMQSTETGPGQEARTWDPRNAAYSFTGLRIVAIPEPGTISLMSLSTLSLFVARRSRRRQAGKTLFPIGREHLCDTFEERSFAYDEMEDSDYLAELKQVAKAYLFSVWDFVHARHVAVDKLFWNRMVAVHARRVARRTAFKAAFKKRLVNGFDSFLALIMK